MIKATCVLAGSVQGTLTFTQDDGKPTKVEGQVTGLTPGKHGFHIHEFGGHDKWLYFSGSPLQSRTEGPRRSYRCRQVSDIVAIHAGDLGNIVADGDGIAKVEITDSHIPLTGVHSIIGRTLVVHEKEDDLGKGGNEESKKTGNAGSRLACGVVGITK